MKSLKYLFLVGISTISLTSCTIYPSNYVGFKMRQSGEFAQSYNIAYIYEKREYTKEDEITLDVYFGHEKDRGHAYGNVALFISIGDFYLDSNYEQYESEEYKTYDDRIYFIDEVEKDLFNSEEYEYTFHSASGFYLGSEFNHHQIVTLSDNLKEYMFSGSSSIYFYLADIQPFEESDWVYFEDIAYQKISYKVSGDKLSFI